MAFWNELILSSGGSGSLTILSATGTVDGVNTAFIFSSQPTLIVSAGSTLRVNEGWTWNGGTLAATLQVPPQAGEDIYGLS